MAGSKASSPSSASAREELVREERIAAGLLVHQPRQGPRARRRAMQGIGDETADIVAAPGARARSPEPVRPRMRIASSVRISGCAGPTSLSR